MKRYLYVSDKNVYKANLHCHTTVSDGAYTPEEIKKVYTLRGYNIVSFTDHNILESHGYLNDETFLAINACEVNINAPRNGGFTNAPTYHFNLFATKPDMVDTPPLPKMEYHDVEAINKYIADRTQEGYLVCYNHPYWSLQTYEEYHRLKGCFAMEIYNHNCEVDEGYYGYNPQVYDEMLRGGSKLFCLSTDDNHNAGPVDLPDRDSFGGFVYVNCNSLQYHDVIDALINGAFYSSQGPEVYEISLEANELTVKCSPVEKIIVYTQGRKCYVKIGEALEGATFQLSGNEEYIRVMCRDKDKKDANSNAYWLNA